MKIHILYAVTVISLTQAAYISRMINTNRRMPTVFRPGVMLRPWSHQRIVPAASHRAPYVVYRGHIPHRYAMKPYNQHFRNVYSGGPWKTGRPPAPPTTEFLRTASVPPVLQSHGGPGAIHTIPAPNLSLSEKPIVVAETSETNANVETASEGTKATYEVTEKYNEPTGYLTQAKIEAPVGFSKQSSINTPELHQFIHTGAGFQLPMQYGGSSPPQNPISPQQFSMPGFTELTGHQDLVQTAAEGIIIPPSALYQNDPNFLQKLQSHLLQQFPSVEFIPYTADAQVKQTSPQPELFLLENEVMPKHAPIAFPPNDYHRNIVQRETQESTIISLPQPFTVANATENFVNATLDQSQNATQIFTSAEPSTTVKNEDTTTEEQKTTIYYAQVGQSVGNVIAKGFYSAINDVRAAAALAQDEKLIDKTPEDATTTVKAETEPTVEEESSKDTNNETIKEANNQLGNQQFEFHEEAPNVTYTLLRSPEEQSKANKDSDIYTGQMVQAMVSEDKDFNKEKIVTASWRPPLRLYAISEKKNENAPSKMAAVKAKIPPKSKLTFDNKTGEPVLRIYASYSENPMQKEVILSKLSNNKHFKEGVTRKQENSDANNFKAATIKTFDKKSNDASQIAQFGLKLRSRSDDYIPLFEEYEE